MIQHTTAGGGSGPGGAVCGEHISLVEAAIHGEEITDRNVYANDACSGGRQVEHHLGYKSLTEGRVGRQ